MRRHGRFFFLGSLLVSAILLAGCNANEGGEGALEAYFGLQSGFSSIPLTADPLTFCCEEEGEVVATLYVEGPLAPVGEGYDGFEHPAQFDGGGPVPAVRYLGLSLKDVEPADALEFQWDGPFVADVNREENEEADLLPFDADTDVGEPPGFLQVSARRCDFERATFTMVVFEFSYLADGVGILVFRTVERDVEIVNTCPAPPPPPPPGAELIVFSNRPPSLGDDTEIWVMDQAGGAANQLTDNEREDWDPAWSPDRTQIAFVSNSQGSGVNLDLMVMDFDGTSAGVPTPLTSFAGSALSARDPAWSPVAGQRKIAFAVGPMGFFDEIWIVDLDQPGAPPVEIDAGTSREVEHLAWSQDGTEIAFCNLGTTYVVPADGSSAPTTHGAGEGWSLDWGPAGFVLHRYIPMQLEPKFRLWKTDSAGNGATPVTSGGTHAYDLTPSWSPMSDRVVFVRQAQVEASSGGRLWTVDADGTDANEIPNQPAGDNSEPDWGFGPQP